MKQINRRLSTKNMDKFFLLGLFLALLVLLYIKSYSAGNRFKVLTAVVTIDRDVDMAQQLYDAIRANTLGEILIVTRENDIETREWWQDKATVEVFPNYEIKGRHNIPKIAEKRALAIDYAKNQGYDAIWFIDSDVIPIEGVLKELSATDKDVCVAQPKVKWAESVVVGIADSEPPFVKMHKIGLLDLSEKRRPCIVAGMACTLIKSSAFDQKMEYYKMGKDDFIVEGEDIGFFMNCYRNGLKCEYLTRWEPPHLYDRLKGRVDFINI